MNIYRFGYAIILVLEILQLILIHYTDKKIRIKGYLDGSLDTLVANKLSQSLSFDFSDSKKREAALFYKLLEPATLKRDLILTTDHMTQTYIVRKKELK